MTALLHLPERLDNGAADDLLAAFQAHQGVALNVDAGAVTHLGTLPAQVLTSAIKSWAASDTHLHFSSVSLAMQTAWTDLGLGQVELPTYDGASR